MYASNEGDEDVVKLFIQAGVDLNTQNEVSIVGVYTSSSHKPNLIWRILIVNPFYI